MSRAQRPSKKFYTGQRVRLKGSQTTGNIVKEPYWEVDEWYYAFRGNATGGYVKESLIEAVEEPKPAHPKLDFQSGQTIRVLDSNIIGTIVGDPYWARSKGPMGTGEWVYNIRGSSVSYWVCEGQIARVTPMESVGEPVTALTVSSILGTIDALQKATSSAEGAMVALENVRDAMAQALEEHGVGDKGENE